MADLKSIFNHPRTEDPEKDPHLYNWKRPFHGKNDAAYLNRLLKSKGRKGSEERNASGRVRANGNENNKKQRVMFKMSYGNSMAKHKRYIQLYMPQIGKDGVEEKKEIFGTPLDEYQKHMSPLHFKFIISPESQQADLQLLSETFISHLEELTGYKFYWLGVVHTDTEHHHAHLSINGIDKNGMKVRFPKDMIKETMREILSNITTNMVGERTPEEIAEAKQRQTMAKRWTNYDEQLKAMPEKIFIKNLNQSLLNRLQFLSTIGMAKKDGFFYSLNPDFEEVMKATGRYNLYLEEYLKSDLPLKLFEGGNITGKVDKVISFDKDESWNDAIIIRTNSERIYIPIFQLHLDNLEGKTIHIDNVAGGTNRNITTKDIKIVNPMKYQKSILR
ncbi:MAG: relaxase/mobilization nuclease domain-containing protein [Treponema sp.]|nr:relaxase/mobilization nuclease domain-containing protein [Treponema sp.]